MNRTYCSFYKYITLVTNILFYHSTNSSAYNLSQYRLWLYSMTVQTPLLIFYHSYQKYWILNGIIADVGVELFQGDHSISVNIDASDNLSTVVNGSRLSQAVEHAMQLVCSDATALLQIQRGEGASEVVHVLTHDIHDVLRIQLKEFLEIYEPISIGIHRIDHALKLFLRNVQKTELTHDVLHLPARYLPISILVEGVEYIFKLFDL